jgi:hypothetical protein
MFDRGDVAIGNVRVHRELRRRRNGSRNRSARHRGNDGQHGDVGHHGNACHRCNDGPHNDAGNINVVANVSSDGNVDLRNRYLGNVGNVRLRLDEHCFFVDSNVNVNIAHRAGRHGSNRNSVGFDGD